MRIQEQYYLSTDGEQTGPFSIGQLISMWSSGAVNNGALYWNEDAAAWSAIADLIPLLSPKKKVGLPPPPPVPKAVIFIQRQGREYGPYTQDQMRAFLAEGSVTGGDVCRIDGDASWSSVRHRLGNLFPPNLSTAKVLGSAAFPSQQVPSQPEQKTKKSGCRWLGIGCLLILALPIGFLVLMVVIGSMLPNSSTSSATSPTSDTSASDQSSEKPLQTDRQVVISDEWIQKGFADFALLNVSDIPKYCSEYDALQEKCKNDLEPYQHVDPSQIQTPDDVDRLVKQPIQKIIDNFKAQVKALEDQYISQKRAVYVPVGSYKITDYLDHQGQETNVYTYADGVFSTRDQGKCYVAANYNGATVYLYVWCQPQLNPPLEFDPNHDVKKDIQNFLDNPK